MIAFIGGIFVGGFIGIVIMCILSVAGRSEYLSKEDDTLDQNEDHTKGLWRNQGYRSEYWFIIKDIKKDGKEWENPFCANCIKNFGESWFAIRGAIML